MRICCSRDAAAYMTTPLGDVFAMIAFESIQHSLPRIFQSAAILHFPQLVEMLFHDILVKLLDFGCLFQHPAMEDAQLIVLFFLEFHGSHSL